MARPNLPPGTQKPISDIQKDSDAKRGVTTKGFKLHRDDIDFIEKTAKAHGMPQSEFIINAARFYAELLDAKKAD